MDHSSLYHGSAGSLQEPLQLKAGSLSMIYLDNALRYICLGNEEVVRMIFPAVRDQNWETVLPLIRDMNVRREQSGFSISITCQYRQKEIDFTAWYQITGLPEGKIVFHMKGLANSSFLKNRIGLCVLHPLKEIVGMNCEVIHPDGSNSLVRLPFHVSPHQPVKNISSLRWDLENGGKALLEFQGDVFEMEDHRNWTDASFKTYSTPLELPFPVTVKAWESMEQVVTLTVENVRVSGQAAAATGNCGDQDTPATVRPNPGIQVSINYLAPGVALSKIGLSANQAEALTTNALSLIRKLNIDHYRLDIRLHTDGWERQLREKVKEIYELNIPLELVLHTSRKYEDELKSLAVTVDGLALSLSHILLFQKGHNTTPGELVRTARKIFGKPGKDIRVGGGTDAYFAELNRERPDTSLMDFVTFSINPQVHAFDNHSMTETLEAQQWVITSAKEYFGRLPVFVSPVTLKPRFNPNATSEDQNTDGTDSRSSYDLRQKSLFGAAWTLGSIKALASPAVQGVIPGAPPSNPPPEKASSGPAKGILPGASSITWFQTTGPGGLMDARLDGPGEGKTLLYPVYFIFKHILEMKQGVLLPSVSSDPLKCEILAMKEGERVKILVTSFTGSTQDIALPLPGGKYSVHYLDEDAYPLMMYDGGTVIRPGTLSPASPEFVNVRLKPFATVIIEGCS
jgi:D-apionolactonase